MAADWSDEEMFENYRRSFVLGKPLRDYTFPFVALVSGRRVSRLLREEFGPRDISDLALPYFCVTANLTAGQGRKRIGAGRCGSGCARPARFPACCRRCSIATKCSSTAR